MQLGVGERVLWQGQPAPGINFAPQDIFIILFGIVWLLIAVGGAGAAIWSGQETDPVAFIILPFFVLIGCYIIFGRFIVDAISRKKTKYVLTTQRAIIEEGLLATSERSVNLAAVQEIGLHRRQSGRGTISFGGATGPWMMMPRNWPGARQFMPPAFDGIDDVARIYELAIRAQRDSRTHPGS